jgi:TonB family protein
VSDQDPVETITKESNRYEVSIPENVVPHSALDAPPKVTRNRDPNWSEKVLHSMNRNSFPDPIELEVLIVVDERGAVSSADIVESDFKIFESDVVEMVRGWQFEPGTEGGKAVRYWIKQPFVFRFRE